MHAFLIVMYCTVMALGRISVFGSTRIEIACLRVMRYYISVQRGIVNLGCVA